MEKEQKRKVYWHANTNSGGTLSLSVNLTGDFSKEEKESAIAGGIEACYEHMKKNGFIPFDAEVMSSGDLPGRYGKTRQYWEKLLNEGKIHYRETSAGRITTNLWVKGYLDNRENVNKYVRNVNAVLKTIEESKRSNGRIPCPVCGGNSFEFGSNREDYTNGICRSCGFYVHTAK